MTGNSSLPDRNNVEQKDSNSITGEALKASEPTKKKKQYNVNIQPYFEYGKSQTGWWSKGHHSYIDFANALIGVGFVIPPSASPDVRYEHWRTMPYGNGYVFVPSSGASPGDFPVTILDGNSTIESKSTSIYNESLEKHSGDTDRDFFKPHLVPSGDSHEEV